MVYTWGAGISLSVEFDPRQRQEGAGAELSFCPNIPGESFHRVKGPVREFDHLHPPGDEVRKEWSYGIYRFALLPSWK